MSTDKLEFQLQKMRMVGDAGHDDEAGFVLNVPRAEFYVASFRTIGFTDSIIGPRQINNVTHTRLPSNKGAGFLAQLPLPNDKSYEILLTPSADHGTRMELQEIVAQGNTIIYAGSLGLIEPEELKPVYEALHDISVDPSEMENLVSYTDALVAKAASPQVKIKPTHNRLDI